MSAQGKVLCRQGKKFLKPSLRKMRKAGLIREEQVEIDISVVEAGEAILAWLDGEELDTVMTRFHSRWNQDA